MADRNHEQRVRELFDQAADLDEAGRERILGAEADHTVVARVRALLRQDASQTISPLQRDMATARLPRIDKYELLRPLGEGGMGEVFLARQLEPVERHVAIKLLRDIDAAPFAAEWFERERQTLARMNHPGIAQIFDGGKTKDGELYLVMEFVRGEPLTAYCERRKLDLHSRLRLLGDVCEAVHHAHQKSVIHRDLKPDNVLVAEVDGKPRCKVIDFGIARTANAKNAATDEDRAVLGTWRYMSPEQRKPTALGLDTRSDVYALGVMLFELIAGANPHQDAGPKDDIAEALTKREPGTELATAGPERLRARAESLATSPHKLLRLLRPELDAIVRRAMAEDRNDRYGSAAELRLDLERFRRNEPLAAMPTTAAYVLRKFFARRRAIAIGAALTLVSMLGAIAGLGYGMFEAQEAQSARAAAHARAMRQLTRAAAQLEFQDLVLFHLDPGTGEAGASMRTVLDRLAPSIAARFAANAQEEAGVRASVGHAYLAVGEPHKALPHLERALELTGQDLDNEASNAIALLNDIARASRLAGRTDESAKHLARLLEVGSRELSSTEPQIAASFPILAGLARTPGAEAEFLREYDRLLAVVESMPRDREVMRLVLALTGATGLLIADSNIASGSALLVRIGTFLKSAYADELDTTFPLVRLAERLLRLGSHADAKALAAQSLELLARIAADRHWMRLQATRVQGLSTALDGDEAAGERVLQALREELFELPSSANEQAIAAANALGELCTRLAAVGKFEAFCEGSLQRWRSASSDGEGDRAWWLASADELPSFAHAAALATLRKTPESARSMRERVAIGSALLRTGATAESFAVLEEAAVQLPTPQPELLADLVRAATILGRKDAALRALEALESLAERPDAAPRVRAAFARADRDFER